MKFVAALDVGTTTIRCFIYDSNACLVGKAYDRVELLYPSAGRTEIDPEKLWNSIYDTIRNSIKAANLSPSDVTCLGICTQRASFLTWNKSTGVPYHNIIAWQDLRADSLVKSWNNSYTMKAIKIFTYILYLLTKNKRFLAGSVIKIMNIQVTMRLVWILRNLTSVQRDLSKGVVSFGTIDSWILYKLRLGLTVTKDIEHISDISNCTTTGFFDPFQKVWGQWVIHLFGIDPSILPKVVPNNYDFGHVEKSLFGCDIKIGICIADQAASFWGSGCFEKGDVKITMGTGSFFTVNTGEKCFASVYGFYPLVAYELTENDKIKKNETAYCMESSSNDTGRIIDWVMEIGLFDEPSKSSKMAESVNDSNGVYFIPAFSGFGPPLNDASMTSGFIGVGASTKKEHMVRAILESLVFRLGLMNKCALEEIPYKFRQIRIDGGVSKNNFICQMLADLIGINVERAKSSDLSALGVCFLAGLNCGVWKNREALCKLRHVDKIFLPNPENKEIYNNRLVEWQNATERFRNWNKIS